MGLAVGERERERQRDLAAGWLGRFLKPSAAPSASASVRGLKVSLTCGSDYLVPRAEEKEKAKALNKAKPDFTTALHYTL